MARCTILRWFGLQDWFDAHFLDLCLAHDDAYTKRVWRQKITADFDLAAGMAARHYAVLAFGTLVFVSTFGTIYWLWKKYAATLRATLLGE